MRFWVKWALSEAISSGIWMECDRKVAIFGSGSRPRDDGAVVSCQLSAVRKDNVSHQFRPLRKNLWRLWIVQHPPRADSRAHTAFPVDSHPARHYCQPGKWAGLVPIHCNECGTEVPDGSRFCNGCGRPIEQNIWAQNTSTQQFAPPAHMAPKPPTTIAQKEAATPSYVIEPEKQTSRAPQILLVLLGISVVALVLMLSKMGQRQSSNGGVFARAESVPAASTVRTENVKIAAGAFIVQPGRYSFSKFTVPQKCRNVRVQGRSTSTGGSDIEVYVLSEGELANWKSGNQAQKIYNSGRVSANTINLRLPATSEGQTAAYYIVFNNKFSADASKALKADVSLYYERTL